MSQIQLISINQQVESLRKELLNLVKRYGFNHPEVIKCSQQLDQFIAIVQKR